MVQTLPVTPGAIGGDVIVAPLGCSTGAFDGRCEQPPHVRLGAANQHFIMDGSAVDELVIDLS